MPAHAELLDAEIAAYHGKGTCTFYGTANTNQMMMEVMGLHMPGAAFVNPGTKLRQELTRAAVHRLAAIGMRGERLPAAGALRRRARDRERGGRAARDGGVDQPPAPRPRYRARRRHRDRLGRFRFVCHGAVPLIARVYPNGSPRT